MISLFHKASDGCSRLVTRQYSTSFSSAIRLLHKDLRAPVCNIYGFVRLADEIVDSFHEHDKQLLLAELERDTFDAIRRGISLNPILHSFQRTVNRYRIEHSLIEAFFQSMQMDLSRTRHDETTYRSYIYGSAEAVGLMCLHVFCDGNNDLLNQLKEPARSLGAAFQKVNFLRDIKADYAGLSRVYFPRCDFENFTCQDKQHIEADIENDFWNARKGIRQLPLKARLGVFVAYQYYFSLFKKIKRMRASHILDARVRIPNYHKALILLQARVKVR